MCKCVYTEIYRHITLCKNAVLCICIYATIFFGTLYVVLFLIKAHPISPLFGLYGQSLATLYDYTLCY